MSKVRSCQRPNPHGARSSTLRGRHKGVLHGTGAPRGLCRVMEVWGFEPQTYGLQSHRSSHLSYTPHWRSNRNGSSQSVQRGPRRLPTPATHFGRRIRIRNERRQGESHRSQPGVSSNTRIGLRASLRTPAGLFKGGDPAAPSGTATLLRLHPPYRAYLRHRPPQGLGERLRVPPTRVV